MSFEVEVVYAGKESQKIISLQMEKGSTVLEAIQQSGIFYYFPEIARQGIVYLEKHVGIYGKAVGLGKKLNSNDRIEIYRDLYQDPKEARRKRAKEKPIQKKSMQKKQ